MKGEYLYGITSYPITALMMQVQKLTPDKGCEGRIICKRKSYNNVDCSKSKIDIFVIKEWNFGGTKFNNHIYTLSGPPEENHRINYVSVHE